MASVEKDCGWRECAVCGERAELNESWMDWVCEMCADGSWLDEIKRRVAAFNGTVTLPMILEKTCEVGFVTVEQVQSKSQKREVVETRWVSMVLAVRHRIGIYAEIGASLGRRDHSTVNHALKMVALLKETDKKFYEKWGELLEEY
jgi:chromosomal replication initiation ATPase DnaA